MQVKGDSNSLRVSLRLFFSMMLILAAGAAFAQPYGTWLQNPSGHGYVQLPSSASLDFGGKSFTFEAWVSVTDGGGCSSLAGNGYTTSMWIGVCGTTLRSYMSGSGSYYDSGVVPAGDWTHVAVTFDAATKTHSHYVDGELTGSRVETSAITAAANPWRIYSDANWQFTPVGGIDEVRIWNVARTKEQIRSTINSEVHSATPGLVGVWAFEASANDSLGVLNGSKNGTAVYQNSAITAGCSTSTNTLCVGPSGRYAVSASWKTVSSTGVGKVVPFTTSESGLFTFFSDTNWEMTVKVLNGCGVNNRWWVFTSGLTDQHVELVVTDLTRGVTKRYFNYLGQPFNAITDTSAFATCP